MKEWITLKNIKNVKFYSERRMIIDSIKKGTQKLQKRYELLYEIDDDKQQMDE